MPKAPKSTRPGRRERMAARSTADRTTTLEPETTFYLPALYLLYENFPFLTEFLLNPTPDQPDQPGSSASSGNRPGSSSDQPGSSGGDQPESSRVATRSERGQLWVKFNDKIGAWSNKPILSKAIIELPPSDYEAVWIKLMNGHKSTVAVRDYIESATISTIRRLIYYYPDLFFFITLQEPVEEEPVGERTQSPPPSAATRSRQISSLSPAYRILYDQVTDLSGFLEQYDLSLSQYSRRLEVEGLNEEVREGMWAEAKLIHEERLALKRAGRLRVEVISPPPFRLQGYVPWSER